MVKSNKVVTSLLSLSWTVTASYAANPPVRGAWNPNPVVP